MTLARQAAAYIAVKRAAGLSLVRQESLLRGFAAHAEARGDRFVRVATALDWAPRASSRGERVRRLHAVCGLAEHLHAEDGRHEVPHRDAMGRMGRHRPPPHLLSPADIGRILKAAMDLPPAGSITPHTFHTIIGLLAATGMRRSEACGLRLKDMTAEGLEIRNAKFGKSRLLPLHETVRGALDAYFGKRGPGGPDDPLFVMPSGRAVNPNYLSIVFRRLARGVGARSAEPGTPGPRLHDLRHGFAVRALADAASGRRRDIGRRMLALSTWLGHSSIASTYWYLEATPVLLDRISDATEELHAGGRHDD